MGVPLAAQQRIDECCKLACSLIPGTILHDGLALCCKSSRVLLEGSFDLRNELGWPTVETQAWRLQVFVEWRHHYGLSSCQIFAYFDCAPVTGEKVLLPPGQHAHIELPHIAWQILVAF